MINECINGYFQFDSREDGLYLIVFPSQSGEGNVNIEDIKQTLMQGHFVMFMLCSIEKLNVSFPEFQTLLKDECAKLGMEVWIQRKEIFDCMHNID